MTPRRSCERTPLLGGSLALLLAIALGGMALLAQPAQPALVLDPHIPNERALIDLGLSGTPGPGQPTRPVTVDRVLVDRAATYVQYHLTGPGGPQGDPLPTLADDQGVMVNGDEYSGFTSSSGWTLPFPLPSWMPWRPHTIWRGYAILGPLPTTARAAVLQFGAPGGPGGPGAGETVRVPLDLHALARRRVAHPGTRVSARGLTVTLRDLDFTHLAYTCALAGSAFADPQGARLMDPTGHVTQTQSTNLGASCGSGPGVKSQSAYIIFPPQRPGTHLTLIIPTFRLHKVTRAGLAQVSLRGPWRFSFVTP